MAKIGFIGMGNMATAIMKGLLKSYAPEEILFSSAHEEKMAKVTAETGVPHASSNIECAKQVKYLVLAVKPQVLPKVFAELKDVVTKEQVIISIAAGYSVADLTEGLGGDVRVVRSMPNTPAMVGEGMTGVCYDAALFTEEEKKTIEEIFTSFGKMEIVEILKSADSLQSGDIAVGNKSHRTILYTLGVEIVILDHHQHISAFDCLLGREVVAADTFIISVGTFV